MHYQHSKARWRGLGAGIGLLLASGLLAACGTHTAAGPASVTAARAAAGGHLYVTNQLDDTLSVVNTQTNQGIDTRTNRVVRDLPAGNYPVAVAVTPDGGSVYVANEENASVSVISARTGKITATIPTGEGPFDVAIAPNGQPASVAVLGPGNVSAINTQTNRISGNVNVGPEGTDPFDIAVTPTAIYVASQAAGTLSVIDPNSLKITATVTLGDRPYGVAVGPRFSDSPPGT